MGKMDMYVVHPEGKREYLRNYGWHFSKKAYKYATKSLRRRVSANSDKTEEVMPYTKDEVEELLEKYGVELKSDIGYDKVYLATMCKADYLGSSIADEASLAKYVGDTINDVDGGDEKVFRHWYSDMIEKGEPIIWEDLI